MAIMPPCRQEFRNHTGVDAAPKPVRQSRDRRVPPDDVHHSFLAQSHVAPNQAVAEPFLVQLHHLLGLLVARALPNLASQDDATGLAAARPDLTRSRMRSRSSSAKPVSKRTSKRAVS